MGETMKIPRLTLLTLGVADLQAATHFYEAVLEALPNRSYEGVTFFELPEPGWRYTRLRNWPKTSRRTCRQRAGGSAA